jgi:hypothetical protein
MRKTVLLVAAAALIVLPASTRSQETDPKQEHQQARGSQAAQSVPPDSNSPDQGKEPGAKTEAPTGSATQVPVPQDSVAAAARKAREQKKESSKPAKVFTNDDIPTSGGISSVGVAAAATTAKAEAGQSTAANDEKTWRDKFAKLQQKLSKDTADLDVMQRELGVLNVQYYNDPVKAMQQQLTRDDINKKTTDIETKKKDIAADQQAIDDAEDDLRKAGGDPGWAR